MDIDVDHAILSRELWVRNVKGKATRVVVTIGKPRHEGRARYICPFSIEGLPSGRQGMVGVGVDEIHALQMAQVAIHAQLTNCDEYIAGRLFWMEPGNPLGVGFPNSPWAATGSTKPKQRQVNPKKTEGSKRFVRAKG